MVAQLMACGGEGGHHTRPFDNCGTTQKEGRMTAMALEGGSDLRRPSRRAVVKGKRDLRSPASTPVDDFGSFAKPARQQLDAWFWTDDVKPGRVPRGLGSRSFHLKIALPPRCQFTQWFRPLL